MSKEAAIAGAGVPPLVADLVRLVGRMFYRDEHAVVLNRLTREMLIREDDLQHVFGLPEKQVRRILSDLIAERMVCQEEVTERIRLRGRGTTSDGASWSIEAKLQELVARAEEDEERRRRFGGGKKDDSDPLAGSGAGRKRCRVVFESDDESDSGEEEGGGSGTPRGTGGAGAGAGGGKRMRRRAVAKVSTTCYYINPRYVVDVIKLRLALMKKHCESLARFSGGEAMYRCGSARCIFECSLMEAEQRRVASSHSKGGVGIGTVKDALFAPTTGSTGASSSASASSSYLYTCPLCSSPLLSRKVENIALAAGRLSAKLQEVLSASGMLDLLKALDPVPLGANRPSDSIKAGLLTLHGPAQGGEGQGQGQAGEEQGGQATSEATGQSRQGRGAQVGGGRPGGDASSGGGAGAGRVYLKTAAVVVEMEGEGSGTGEGGAGKLKVPTIQAPTAVSASTVPDFLLRSQYTGEAAGTFGFMKVAEGGAGMSAAAQAQGGEQVDVLLATGAAAAQQDVLQRVLAAVSSSSSSSGGGAGGAGGAGGGAWAYDADINADLAREGQGEGGTGEPSEDNAALWAALFQQIMPAAAAGGDGGEEEWEDV